MKVSLFIPCLVDQFLPEIGEATARLLTQLGAEVDYDSRQTCCGQPLINAGRTRERTGRPAVHRHHGGEHVCRRPVGILRPYRQGPLSGASGRNARPGAGDGSGRRTYELSDFLINVMKAADIKDFPRRRR